MGSVNINISTIFDLLGNSRENVKEMLVHCNNFLLKHNEIYLCYTLYDFDVKVHSEIFIDKENNNKICYTHCISLDGVPVLKNLYGDNNLNIIDKISSTIRDDDQLTQFEQKCEKYNITLEELINKILVENTSRMLQN